MGEDGFGCVCDSVGVSGVDSGSGVLVEGWSGNGVFWSIGDSTDPFGLEMGLRVKSRESICRLRSSSKSSPLAPSQEPFQEELRLGSEATGMSLDGGSGSMAMVWLAEGSS